MAVAIIESSLSLDFNTDADMKLSNLSQPIFPRIKMESLVVGVHFFHSNVRPVSY